MLAPTPGKVVIERDPPDEKVGSLFVPDSARDNANIGTAGVDLATIETSLSFLPHDTDSTDPGQISVLVDTGTVSSGVLYMAAWSKSDTCFYLLIPVAVAASSSMVGAS